ncbi:MAG: 16S rRNA (cytosine(967)-C(5))-methyltransferase RsmB [Chromatiales bacterium]|nr:16S rRNA (cytosine(967)-C(5))-methyltransferase RsmB [Chromatiales bacterium]
MPIVLMEWCLVKSANTRKPATGAARNPRALAAKLLAKLAGGSSLTVLFQEELGQVTPADRALIKAICFGVARYWPRLNALTEGFLNKPMKAKDRDIHCLLLVGFYQLLYMRTADHAAVAETVEAARRLKKPWAAGLINGVLRRLQREQALHLARLKDDPALLHACPDWLLKRLQGAWPEQWQQIAEAYNRKPPMSLRVNLAKVSRQDYIRELTAGSQLSRPIPDVPSGLVLDGTPDVVDLPGFAEGWVSVQDGGAQLAGCLLDPRPGQRVLDACAAPGGKTGHLLELECSIELTAIDVDRDRLQRVTENLQRLQLSDSVRVCQGDAAKPDGAWAEKLYDRILLDVPCSATGVIRRHPDIKVLRRDADIAQLVQKQQEILVAVWPLLKPGGRLLYATCSVLPEENQQQVERFLAQYPDAREQIIEASWGHSCSVGRQTLPGEATMDGFYYACLEKLN